MNLKPEKCNAQFAPFSFSQCCVFPWTSVFLDFCSVKVDATSFLFFSWECLGQVLKLSTCDANTGFCRVVFCSCIDKCYKRSNPMHKYCRTLWQSLMPFIRFCKFLSSPCMQFILTICWKLFQKMKATALIHCALWHCQCLNYYKAILMEIYERVTAANEMHPEVHQKCDPVFTVCSKRWLSNFPD